MSDQLQIIGGRYEFNRKFCLGQGNFGKVYQGTDIVLKAQVAIKEIDRKNLENSEYQKKLFDNEVEILKSLKKSQNPNIVQFIDIIETNNYLYLVQEFCKDGDLKDKISNLTFIEEDKAFSILQQIISAFLYLRKFNIIHRDLKPANILINNGVYKLADFGFAKLHSDEKMLKSVVGSPYYMSPQLLASKPYTYKTDIWSLGIIYYEMLFGDLPWYAKEPKQLLKKILNDPVNCKRKNIQLQQTSIDFLKLTIQVDENYRASWDDIEKFMKQCQKQNTMKQFEERNNNTILFSQKMLSSSKYTQAQTDLTSDDIFTNRLQNNQNKDQSLLSNNILNLNEISSSYHTNINNNNNNNKIINNNDNNNINGIKDLKINDNIEKQKQEPTQNQKQQQQQQSSNEQQKPRRGSRKIFDEQSLQYLESTNYKINFKPQSKYIFSEQNLQLSQQNASSSNDQSSYIEPSLIQSKSAYNNDKNNNNKNLLHTILSVSNEDANSIVYNNNKNSTTNNNIFFQQLNEQEQILEQQKSFNLKLQGKKLQCTFLNFLVTQIQQEFQAFCYLASGEKNLFYQYIIYTSKFVCESAKYCIQEFQNLDEKYLNEKIKNNLQSLTQDLQFYLQQQKDILYDLEQKDLLENFKKQFRFAFQLQYSEGQLNQLEKSQLNISVQILSFVGFQFEEKINQKSDNLRHILTTLEMIIYYYSNKQNCKFNHDVDYTSIFNQIGSIEDNSIFIQKVNSQLQVFIMMEKSIAAKKQAMIGF